jgi:hypothetical protein
MFQRQGVVFWIKRTLIPSLTEINTSLIVRMILELLADIAVFVGVVQVVVALEQAVVLDYPKILFADIRSKNSGGDLTVIVRSKEISDIMQQSADNRFFIGTITFGPRGGLQGMCVTVHPVA